MLGKFHSSSKILMVGVSFCIFPETILQLNIVKLTVDLLHTAVLSFTNVLLQSK